MTRDYSTVPAKVTIANSGAEDTSFRYYRVNFVEVLKPEDEVIITVASSEELAYYMALNDTEKGITVTTE